MFTGSAILTYHSLDGSGSPISIAPELFERHMELLASSVVPVVALDAVTRVRPSLALTFDDGFVNFAEVALPLLVRFRLPATVFIVTGHCGLTSPWRWPRLPCVRAMSWDTLRTLPSDLVTVGSHSASHPHLTRLPAALLAAETHASRATIEDRIGRSVPFFAYPFGASNARVRRVVRQGFQLACGTTLRCLSPAEDLLDLPRVDAYYLRDTERFSTFVSGRARAYLLRRRYLRALRACITP